MVIDKRILIPFWLLVINAFALDITNDGNMCLYNKVFKEPAAVTGSGCITIEEKSAIYLSESHLSIPSTQDIYLANGESSIVVKAETRPKTFNVYGFVIIPDPES
ncbi:Hyphally regulated cell wall protein 3 [Candida tropicalis]